VRALASLHGARLAGLKVCLTRRLRERARATPYAARRRAPDHHPDYTTRASASVQRGACVAPAGRFFEGPSRQKSDVPRSPGMAAAASLPAASGDAPESIVVVGAHTGACAM
jgi:hypothetical protein